jgi:hypothetical protein
MSWFWLRRFGVATTRENCVRFSKGVSVAGMVLVTVGAVLVALH